MFISKMGRILKCLKPFGCILIFLGTASTWTTEELVNHSGHLKEFGYSEDIEMVAEFSGFPYTQMFFEEYVRKSRPVLLKKAAMLSPAFSLWSDEYFLQLDEPADHRVLIENKKKENRSESAVKMSFKNFVKIYNHTDQYMVNTIPNMITSDVILPGPLQCEQIQQKNILLESVMWFSSGGTKSVVHTDDVDNINCLFRGEKKLIMVDPEKYADKVDLDHPEGAYSDIDVDRVDLLKYPDLANVKYIHADMKPGDCLYIPYKWIHQVRSYGSNIAVNVWWNYHKASELDLDQCQDHFDPDLTLDKVNFDVSGSELEDIDKDTLKGRFLDNTQQGPLDFQSFLDKLIANGDYLDGIDTQKAYQVPLKSVFEILDQNDDKLVTSDEINNAYDEDGDDIIDYMMEFDSILVAIEETYPKIRDEPLRYEGDGKEELTVTQRNEEL